MPKARHLGEVLTPDFLRKDGAIETVMAPNRKCSTTIWKRCRGFISTSGRRTLFRVAASVAAGQGTDADQVHEIRVDGGLGESRKRSCR
jgi:hypothetical protein